MHPTFWGAACTRVGTSSGRRLASSARSATRAERAPERTEANVATARISVPAAVARLAATDQSNIAQSRWSGKAGTARGRAGREVASGPPVRCARGLADGRDTHDRLVQLDAALGAEALGVAER